MMEVIMKKFILITLILLTISALAATDGKFVQTLNQLNLPKYTKNNVPSPVLPKNIGKNREENFTLLLIDSYGDGWDGAYMHVYVNGAEQFDGHITCDGEFSTYYLAVENGDSISTVYTAGNYENEHSYNFYDQDGNFIIGDGPNCGAGIGFIVEISNVVEGCTDETAQNYNPDANVDDGSCCYDNWFLVECGGGSYQSEISWEMLDVDGNIVLSGGAPYSGNICIDENLYYLHAMDSYGDGWTGNVFNIFDEDGNVLYNYTLQNGSEETVVCLAVEGEPGCTDPDALNYNPDATTNDGSCFYTGDLCDYPFNATIGVNHSYGNEQWYALDITEVGFLQVNLPEYEAVQVVGDCGVTDDEFDDFIGGAYQNLELFISEELVGTTIHIRLAGWHVSEGMDFEIRWITGVYGCTDSWATNYNPDANISDNSCEYLPCDATEIQFNLVYDNYPEEISWKLMDSDGVELYTGLGAVEDSLYATNFCLPDGAYTLGIYDSYGDGLCCEYGDGYYLLMEGSDTLATGGEFTHEAAVNFTIEPDPAIAYTPSEFNIVMDTAQDTTGSMTISNVGAENSMLTYDIFFEYPDEINRDISGSSLTCLNDGYFPGITANYYFEIYNASVDNEWIESAELHFPEGITINSVSSFVGGSDGDLYVNSEVASNNITWEGTTDNGWGVIKDGEYASAVLNITIAPDFSGELLLDWTLYGDIWGGNPHEVSDVITLIQRNINVVPNHGEIGAGESFTHTLHYNTEDIAAGTYSVNVVINNNTSDVPEIIPITLTVRPFVGLEYNPSFFTQNMSPQQEVSQILEIVNSGSDGTSLYYDLEVAPQADWLELSHQHGECEANETSEINLTFDSASLTDGTYYTEIFISNNAHAGEVFIIPITLVVESFGQIGGHVVNEMGEVIHDATVSAGNQSVITDETGAYLMTLPHGTYNVVCSANSYQTAIMENVEVEESMVYEVDFTLENMPAQSLPFVENWDEPAGWSYFPDEGNWEMTEANEYGQGQGRPAPAAIFRSQPIRENYSYALESPALHPSEQADIFLNYQLRMRNLSWAPQPTVEYLKTEVGVNGQWTTVTEYSNVDGSIWWTTEQFNITEIVGNNDFKIRFIVSGTNSYNIVFWMIDNIYINQTANAGFLQGYVTNEDNGEPIFAYVHIETDDSEGIDNITTMTDENGFYSLSLPAGHYELMFVAPSYANAWWGVDITPGEVEALNMALEPIQTVNAEFSADIVEGRAPLEVNFEDESGGYPYQYFWDFDNDGIYDSNQDEPEWTYYHQGTYTVKLLILCDGGSSEIIKENYITVALQENGTDVDEDANIEGDWTYANSPYNLNTSITIQENDTLNIEAGSYIIINGNIDISVNGTINGDSLIFVNNTSREGEWGGITISNSENSVLENCFFFDTSTALTVNGASPTIKNCIFTGNPDTALRRGAYGLKIMENANPIIENNIFEDFESGILIDNRLGTSISSPIITNNSILCDITNLSRTTSNGISISGSSTATIEDNVIDGYDNGIVIVNDSGTLATPTVMNNSVVTTPQYSREHSGTGNGILIDGYVSADIIDNEIEEYPFGIVYDFSGPALAEEETPTLTNNRVLTSPQRTREEGQKGIWIQNIKYIEVDSNFVNGYETGIEFGNDEADTSTPTLTNNRVLNSPQRTRNGNVGIRILGNVAGETHSNEITACDSAIVISEAVPKIYENLLYLENMGSSVAISAENASGLNVFDNTIYNYNTGFVAQNTVADFTNNIVWHVTNGIDETGSVLTVNYNNILGGYTGLNNINVDPQFTSVDSADVDFLHLNWTSECIDAGDPSTIDEDGTISDVGANSFTQLATLSTPNIAIALSTTIQLSWNEIPGAIRYNIYKSTTPNGTYNFTATVRELNWTDGLLQRYFYKIKAANNR